jgi:hypothetical protein
MDVPAFPQRMDVPAFPAFPLPQRMDVPAFFPSISPSSENGCPSIFSSQHLSSIFLSREWMSQHLSTENGCPSIFFSREWMSQYFSFREWMSQHFFSREWMSQYFFHQHLQRMDVPAFTPSREWMSQHLFIPEHLYPRAFMSQHFPIQRRSH